MSAYELKGNLFDLIWGLRDKETLLEIKEAVVEIIKKRKKEETDWWDELTEQQQAQLRKSIEETQRGENLIPHEQVMKEIEERFKTIVP